MTHTFTPGVYTMRNGLSATVYEVTDTGQLLGVLEKNDRRYVNAWDLSGRVWAPAEHEHDLMPPKQELWLNIYRSFTASYLTREAADNDADKSRIACIRVEFTEGEGL